MDQLDNIVQSYKLDLEEGREEYATITADVAELEKMIAAKQAKLTHINETLVSLPQYLHFNILDEVKRSTGLLETRDRDYQKSLESLANLGDSLDEEEVVITYERTDNKIIRSSLEDAYHAAKIHLEERSKYADTLKEPIIAGVIVQQADNENAQLYVTVPYKNQMPGLMGSLTEAVGESVLMSGVEFEEASVDGILSLNVLGNVDGLIETLKSRDPKNFEEANVIYSVFVLGEPKVDVKGPIGIVDEPITSVDVKRPIGIVDEPITSLATPRSTIEEVTIGANDSGLPLDLDLSLDDKIDSDSNYVPVFQVPAFIGRTFKAFEYELKKSDGSFSRKYRTVDDRKVALVEKSFLMDYCRNHIPDFEMISRSEAKDRLNAFDQQHFPDHVREDYSTLLDNYQELEDVTFYVDPDGERQLSNMAFELMLKNHYSRMKVASCNDRAVSVEEAKDILHLKTNRAVTCDNKNLTFDEDGNVTLDSLRNKVVNHRYNANGKWYPRERIKK
ncbi:hypothetical protein HN662_04785 [Candidatus Woesearchaeota archaeon]|jgi:vacuolar-type H+-ATPase subunit E/Vma4|nr:hypothetical protein [Candidatus Woesearchaeota archaeon]